MREQQDRIQLTIKVILQVLQDISHLETITLDIGGINETDIDVVTKTNVAIYKFKY